MSTVSGAETAVGGLAVRRRRRRGRLKPSQVLLPLLIVLVCLGIWEFLARDGAFPSYALPSPTSIASTAVNQSSDLLSASLTTGFEMIVGYGAAIVVGFALATLMVYITPVENGLYPLLITTQCIPILAISPLLLIWFGFGATPKALVVFIFCFFPIVLNTVAGMQSVERDRMLLMKSLGASGWNKYWRVRVPASMPRLFTGLSRRRCMRPLVPSQASGSERRRA